MDDQRSKAVTDAFVRLYKQGLVYRTRLSRCVIGNNIGCMINVDYGIE
ncbi:hypothetical protein A2U01_0020824 [Trifolium medium]|uniref:Uncharacterized protein n=1 Tax=Trifolium medium TaxID=97028 RepID=A0A392NKN3_9FABA|nr:hypothetical protein [Trifolium medium]